MSKVPFAQHEMSDAEDKSKKVSGDDDDEEPLRPLHNDEGKRKVTDVLCTILFIVAMGAMFGISIWAWSEGEYRKLVNGIDYRGCVCGTKCTPAGDSDSVGKLGERAIRAIAGGTLVTLCAHTCPTDMSFQSVCYNASERNELIVTDDKEDCADDRLFYTDASDYKSVFRRCRPKGGGSSRFTSTSDEWTEAFDSTRNGAEIIVLGAVIAVLTAYAYLVFLQACAKVFTYIGMAVILIALVASGAFMYISAQDLKDEVGTSDTNYRMRLAGAVIAWSLAGLFACFLVFMCKRIKLAVKVIQMASKAVRSAPFLPVVPTLLFVLVLGITAVWAMTAVLMFTVGGVKTADVQGIQVRTLSVSTDVRYAFLYHLFGFFWVTMLIVALVEMTTAFVITSWYFAPRGQDGDKQTASSPVRRAFWYSIRYHFGSLAFGSLLIAIIKTIRAVLEYIEQRLKQSGNDNKLVKCALCCCKCFMWCLEKCMRFINKIAYIMVVLTGKSFLPSAFKAGKMIFNNFARVGALAMVSAGFLLLGKIVVAALSAVICFAILTRVDRYADESRDTAVANPFIVVILVGIVAWTIGALFMNILDTATDAMLVSYIYNEKMQIIDSNESQELEAVNNEAKAAGYGGDEEKSTTNAYTSAGEGATTAQPQDGNEANYGE